MRKLFLSMALGLTALWAGAQEIPAPPTPTWDADQVVSVLCDAYPQATEGFNIGGWGQSTVATQVEDQAIYHITNFNYLGWEFAKHIDVSNCNMMHVDFYPVTDGNFGFTPISPGQEAPYIASSVVKDQWNSYDVPLSHWGNVNFKDLFQIKFDQGNGAQEGYIANVYFYNDPSVFVPTYEYGNVYYGSVEGVYKDIPVAVDYALTANADGTLTIEATLDGVDKLNANHKFHIVYDDAAYKEANGGNFYETWDELVYDETTDTWKYTTKNTIPFTLKTRFSQLHCWFEYAGGVVNNAVEGYLFGKSSEKPVKEPRLTLTAQAQNITSNSAEIAYTLRMRNVPEGTEAEYYLDGEKITDNPVALTGLTEKTDYTRTLKAVVTVDGKEYSTETTVKFTTLRDGAAPALYHVIADGMLKNAFLPGETEGVDSRDLPMSIVATIHYNPDQTITVDAKFTGNVPVGFVPAMTCSTNDIKFESKDANLVSEGHYIWTTDVTYPANTTIGWFNFLVKYAGGPTTISINGYTTGNENEPVTVGEATSLELSVAKTSLQSGESVFLTATAKDAAGHYVYGKKITYSLSNDDAFAINGNKIVANNIGSTTLTATCDYFSATTTLVCATTKEAVSLHSLEGVNITSDHENYAPAFDGNEGTQVEWNNLAEIGEEHYIQVDLGQARGVQAIELVWEGACAKEFTVTLSMDAPASAAQRAAAEIPSNVVKTYTVDDNVGGAGVTVRNLLFDEASPTHNARYVTLATTKAHEPAWGIKLKEMNIMGTPNISGVADVAVDANDAPAEYYNLQGVRVSGELVPGIYIRRQGNTAVKVMVK